MKKVLLLSLLGSFVSQPLVQGFSLLLVTNNAFQRSSPNQATTINYRRNSVASVKLYGMKRPILDTLATTLFRLENARVEASSKVDEQGRVGEPMEWSESSSFANQFSEAIASNSLGYQFKQFVADIVAGDYDEEIVNAKVDSFVAKSKNRSTPVVMFSFTTCPFCRRAKDYLDEKGIKYNVMELDELDGNEGNEIRAVLGKKTKRTSVPSIFLDGQYIGGCNDGPGLLPLGESGELDKLIQSVQQKNRFMLLL